MNTGLLCLALAGTLALPLSAEENTATTDLLRQMADRPLTQVHMVSSYATIAELRAEYFPDLALIPADAEAFVTIPDIQGSINRMMAFAPVPFLLSALQEKGISIAAPPVKSITIATGPGTSAAIGHAATLLETTLAQTLCLIPEAASPNTETQALDRIASLWTVTFADILTQPLPSITCIAELTPEAHNAIQNRIRQIKEINTRPGAEQSWHEGRYAGLAWQGISFKPDTTTLALKQIIRAKSDEERNALLNLTRRLNKTLYLLTAVKDGKLLIVFCENPEKNIRLAATPAQSVLSTQKADIADSRLSRTAPPDMLFYIGSPANKTPQASQGLSGVIWGDRGAHLEIAERSLSPSTLIDFDTPLKLASMTNRPDTILYAEGALSPQALTAVNNFYSGLATRGGKLFATLPVIPGASAAGNGTLQILSGLGGRKALLVNNRGKMPDILASEPLGRPMAKDLDLPSPALYTNIANSALVEQGWTSLESGLKQGIATMKFAPLGWPSLQRSTRDGIDTFTFTPTVRPADFKIVSKTQISPQESILNNIAVSRAGTSLAIGTSAAYTEEIVRTAETSSGNLKGAAFAFRMEPVRQLMNRNFTVLRSRGTDTMQTQGAFNFIFSQIDGLYATVTRQNSDTVTHIYFKTK